MVQTNIVLAIASDEDNPITAAISTAIDSLTNPSPTPTPTSTPVSTPISIPVTQPTPTPSSNPVTSPVTSPVTNPSPSSTSSPSPTPAPIPTPVINTVFPNPATWGTIIVLTGSNLTNATQIFINDTEITPISYSPALANDTSISFQLSAFLDYQAGQTYKISVKNDGVESNGLDLTIAPSVILGLTTLEANQILINPQVNLDANHPEVLMAYSNFNTNISIPQAVINPTLNFSDILQTVDTGKQVSFNNMITINSNTALGTVKIEIPTATIISGPSDWNGVMNAPQITSITGTIPVADTGKTATPQVAIEVGLGDTPLILNKAVRIVIPGQAGKLVGFQRGSTFTKIAQNCTADTQDAGNNLSDGGDCYIGVGNDLVVWTKHFTKFITYTQTAQTTQPAGSGNPEPPVCGDSKPVSSPKLLSAKATGRNEVTLSWEKAPDPVSYYLVAYGTKPGQPEYGNPNIGNRDTQSYVIKGLDTGQTYYFKVRAGNGCMPGEFSNELSVPVLGDKLSGPAKGFKSGVLSSTKAELKFKPITEAKPDRLIKTSSSSVNFLSWLFNFLTSIFRS